MRLARKKIDRLSVVHYTCQKRRFVEHTVKQALLFLTDPQKTERLKVSLCIYCYYVPERIGGAAISSRQCGMCETEIGSGNTNVDALCPSCAETHELCAHCGADLKLRPRRMFRGEAAHGRRKGAPDAR